MGQAIRSAAWRVDPLQLDHKPPYPAKPNPEATLPECQPHTGNTIIIIVGGLCPDCLHGRRKNRIFGWFPAVTLVPVVTGFADGKNTAHKFHGPSSFLFPDKGKAFVGSYFFRRTAKKPSASCNISLARFSSAFSFSSSRIRCSAASFGIRAFPLPGKACCP